MAHKIYMTEVSQKSDTIRFTLYEKAKLDVAKIPEFVASYGNSLKFTMDAKAPFFTYFLKKNSREKNVDALVVLNDFLKAASEKLKLQQTAETEKEQNA